jgi:hypothetical protein
MSNFIGNFGSLAFMNNKQNTEQSSPNNSINNRQINNGTHHSANNETSHFLRNGPLNPLPSQSASLPQQSQSVPPPAAPRQTWNRPANNSISYDLFDIQMPSSNVNSARFPNRFATLGNLSNRSFSNSQTTPASTNISAPSLFTNNTNGNGSNPNNNNNNNNNSTNVQPTQRITRTSTFVLETDDSPPANPPPRPIDINELYNVHRRARAKTPMAFNFMLNDDSSNEIQFDSNGSSSLVVYGNSVERPRVNYSAKKKARLIVGKLGRDSGELIWPIDVAINVFNNQIIIGDSNNHRIQIFEFDGRFVKNFGSKGKKEGQFDSITGIFADSMANIFVVDRMNHRVQIFDRYCRFVRSIGSGQGSAPGKLNHPWGIAVSLISESNFCFMLLISK